MLESSLHNPTRGRHASVVQVLAQAQRERIQRLAIVPIAD